MGKKCRPGLQGVHTVGAMESCPSINAQVRTTFNYHMAYPFKCSSKTFGETASWFTSIVEKHLLAYSINPFF